MTRQARKQKHSTAVEEIPLSQPDRKSAKYPTLFDLAAEKEAQLRRQNDKIVGRDRGIRLSNAMKDDGPFVTALLYGTSLSMLHFTLDVLVHQQYNQHGDHIPWLDYIAKMKYVLPVLCLLIYIMHTRTAKSIPLLRQLLFLASSLAAGCYLVYSSNRHGYFAVMKRAPPVGTLLVWGFVEIDPAFALSCLACVVGYTVWRGYSII